MSTSSPAQAIIRVEQGICPSPAHALAAPFDFTAFAGEHIAIVGPNAGGKSRLVDLLTSRHRLQYPWPRYDFRPSSRPLAADNIRIVTFRDSYGDADSGYYLQQRWNPSELDENFPTTGELLERSYAATGDDIPARRKHRERLYELFEMHPLLDKCIVSLSSGELRKFTLVRALLGTPRVLVMDNPYIGLDAATRDRLTQLLDTLAAQPDLQIILVLSRADEVPDFVTHVYEVDGLAVGPKQARTACPSAPPRPAGSVPDEDTLAALRHIVEQAPPPPGGNEVVRLNDVSIRYGDHTLLDRLTWVVRKGERWALRGRNGAGKSTLLSLVCADNPQGYACDIALFGRRRGTGESIWEIKRHIGYVSPEMHRAYRRNVPALRIVASGLTDRTGLYVQPAEEDYEAARRWMAIFGLSGLEERPFLQLSGGEQRLVLLARAFVKFPALLVLDEPMHGLDERNCRRVKRIIDAYCSRPDRTLVMVTHYDEELPACITQRLELRRPAEP